MNATLPVADAGTAASAAPTLAPWPLRALLRTAGTLLPHATGQFLARRMLTPRRRPVRPQAWIAAAAALKIPAEGGMVNAYRWGDGGATVLLMHGWEGGVDDFAALVPQLAGAGFS
ncbi:MAG TPA: hypothetical protein VHE37_14330, partial [Nevskiaceae bacterium]|nr:hypothetical protein [Nevskiaceae bacterium]